MATAIPKITEDFRSLDEVGWYGSAFFLTLAVFQSPWGKIHKYFPLKIAYAVSVFIFEFGSLICGMYSTVLRSSKCGRLRSPVVTSGRIRHSDTYFRGFKKQPNAHCRPCNHWLRWSRNHNRHICHHRASGATREGSCFHRWYRGCIQHCEPGWSSHWRSVHRAGDMAVVVSGCACWMLCCCPTHMSCCLIDPVA